jgi:tight adherence protein C
VTGTDVALLAVAAIGAALVLDRVPWFRRGPLVARLRPYAPPTATRIASRPARSVVGTLLLPPVEQLVASVTATMGITEDLATRLERAGDDREPASFRVRQATHAVLGALAGVATAVLVRPGPLASALLVAGAPLLCALVDEQRLSSRVAARQEVRRLELPVVAEQLGVLVDAGASLPAAISRVARRGRGQVAADLARVSQRIRQGLGEDEALEEWADRSDLDAVRRLVRVLALHRDAGDLGRLIAAEARAIRAETHRDLVERIERRGEAVWIPVTVATLVPGLLFLAVPFVSAITHVTGT